MISWIGVPVVTPSKTPLRILTRSSSCRCVVKRDWPGLRLSSHCWMSGSASGRRGGTPSTTTPIAGPWLSPHVVKRNSVPKELPAIVRSGHRDVRRVDGLHPDDVIAAVDMMHFAADPSRKIAQEIQPGATDIFDRDIALQW